jgi:hypothetical protein
VLVIIIAPEVSELPKPQAFQFEHLYRKDGCSTGECSIMQDKSTSASTDMAMMEGTRGLLKKNWVYMTFLIGIYRVYMLI